MQSDNSYDARILDLKIMRKRNLLQPRGSTKDSGKCCLKVKISVNEKT